MIPTVIPLSLEGRRFAEPRMQSHQTSPHQGLRFCPVVLSTNGRVKPDWVIVNGKEERYIEGAYYIEWRDGSKRIRESVGKNAADANARRLRKEAELNAVNNGVPVVDETQNSDFRHRVRLRAGRVCRCCEEREVHGSHRRRKR